MQELMQDIEARPASKSNCMGSALLGSTAVASKM